MKIALFPRLGKTLSQIKADYYFLRETKPSLRAIVATFIFEPGFRALLITRLQQCISDSGHHRLALLICNLNVRITGAEICVGAQIGAPCIIRHPVGIVIGGGVTIGSHCILLQGVTIGQSHVKNSSENRYPSLGDNVTVGVKASILGDIFVASGTSIGAHAVLLNSTIENGVYVGIPATLIRDAK